MHAGALAQPKNRRLSRALPQTSPALNGLIPDGRVHIYYGRRMAATRSVRARLALYDARLTVARWVTLLLVTLFWSRYVY